MLHAPASETKTETTQSKPQLAPQPERELHPHSLGATGVYASSGAGSAASVRSPGAQRHQIFAGMQAMHGNQAVLRMVQSSPQVARMPALRPSQGVVLQRKCACGGTSESEGECAECKAKREGALQRRVANQGAPAAANSIPPIVHNVLNSPGQSLDAGTRAFMEPRFGYDFSQVRVHTDAKAAESARAVNALAYTVGRNVVFGIGQYAPGTTMGRKLLTHELTHVVQQHKNLLARCSTMSKTGDRDELEAEANAQRVIEGWPVRELHAPTHTIQRAPANETQVTVTQTGSCTVEQGNALMRATQTAQGWLNTAINRLNEYIALPVSDRVQDVAVALDNNFRTKSVFHAELIRDRLLAVRDNLTSRQNFTSSCAPENDQVCGSAGAYTLSDVTGIRWCPSFFKRGSPTWQIETVIHESAHAFAPRVYAPTVVRSVGDLFVTDRGYVSQRIYYPYLRPEEAMDNADSYAYLAEDLSMGPISLSKQPKSPEDTIKDCPPGTPELVRRALAFVESWNRNAVTALSQANSSPEATTYYEGLRQQYFGTSSKVKISDLLDAYKLVEGKLNSAIPLECETAGGACSGSTIGYYRYFLWWSSDVLHLCPSWFTLSDEEARIQSLYALVLADYANVPESDRYKYVDLAQRVSRNWGTPPPLPTEPFPKSTVPGTEIA